MFSKIQQRGCEPRPFQTPPEISHGGRSPDGSHTQVSLKDWTGTFYYNKETVFTLIKKTRSWKSFQ